MWYKTALLTVADFGTLVFKHSVIFLKDVAYYCALPFKLFFKKQNLIETIAALCAFLFLYAAFSKYAYYGKFIWAMRNQPFPKWMQYTLAWTLPPFEIVIALMSFFDRTRLLALYVFCALMTAFTAYVSLFVWHVIHRVPCTCGGAIRQLSWPQHLILNSSFVLLSFVDILLINDKLREGFYKRSVQVRHAIAWIANKIPVKTMVSRLTGKNITKNSKGEPTIIKVNPSNNTL